MRWVATFIGGRGGSGIDEESVSFMGLMSLFEKPAPVVQRLPAGSFTVDRMGRLVAQTLPSTFPENLVRDIARQVLATFQAAAAAQVPPSELVVHYSSLKLTARELRGGAIVFLVPTIPQSGPVSSFESKL
jgi:hypothetical protein